MSFRGGGRGRGRGGRGFGGGRAAGEVKQGTYDLFPKLSSLPEKKEVLPEEEWLLIRKRRLESFWRYSPYFLEKPAMISRGKVAEVERYSDKKNPKIQAKRFPLSSYLTPSYFPEELVKGSRRGQQSKEHYSRQPDLLRLNKLVKLEEEMQKNEGQDDKGEKKKKEDEDEEAGEEEELELEEELIGEDDYNQIYGFDDDDEYLEEDDGGEDEGPTYD